MLRALTAREGCPLQRFTAMCNASISLHCKENLETKRTPRPTLQIKDEAQSVIV
jgi:hypothetical protein